MLDPRVEIRRTDLADAPSLTVIPKMSHFKMLFFRSSASPAAKRHPRCP